MSTNDLSVKPNSSLLTDQSTKQPVVMQQQQQQSAKREGQQRANGQSTGSGRVRPSPHQRPSNIGKNPNPVLVMTPQEQRAKISHLHRASQSERSKPSDPSGRQRKPQQRTNLMDKDSFPEALGSFPLSQPEVDQPESSANVKFGSIESKLPRLDYSRIATMHTTQQSKTESPAQPTKAELPTQAPKTYSPMPAAQVGEQALEVRPLQPVVEQATPVAFESMEQPAQHPEPQYPQPGARMGQQHPFPQYPMHAPPYPMAPWMGQAPHGHPYMGAPPPSYPHPMQQEQPQPVMPYSFHPQHMPGSAAPMRMMPPPPMHPHHPSMLPMMVVPPAQPAQQQMPLPERKKIILDFRDPETGAAVLIDEQSKVEKLEGKPAEETKEQSVEEEPVPKIVLIEPAEVEIESKFIAEPNPIEQTVLIDREPEMLEKVVERMQELDMVEEGEIQVKPIEKPGVITLLQSNEHVAYPESVASPSIVKKGARISYSIPFLIQFQPFCTDLPEGTPDGEYLAAYTGTIATNYLQLAQARQSSPAISSGSRSLSSKYPSSTLRKSSLPPSGKLKSASRKLSVGKGAPWQTESTASLHQAEHAWSRGGTQTATTEEEDPDQQVKRRFNGILNKLSRENFDILYKEIRSLDFSGHVVFGEILDKVYDKAVQESGFADLYAKLVLHLSQDYRTFPDVDEEVVKKAGSITRVMLLGRCQLEYSRRNLWNAPSYQTILDEVEIPTHVPLDKPDEMSVEEYWRSVLRKRSLGNIRFVGELFKLGVIHETIIIRCLQGLLEPEHPEGEELESLCKLLTTTGARLDSDPKIKLLLDQLFTKIERLSGDTKLNSRIRFQLMDLTDKRARHWDQVVAGKPAQSRKIVAKRPAASARKTPETPTQPQAKFPTTNNQSKFSLLNEEFEEEVFVKESAREEPDVEQPAKEKEREEKKTNRFTQDILEQQLSSAIKEYLTFKDPVGLVLSFAGSGYDQMNHEQGCLLISLLVDLFLQMNRPHELDLVLTFFHALLTPSQYLPQLRDMCHNPEQPYLFTVAQIREGITLAMQRLEDTLMDAPFALRNAARLINDLIPTGQLWKSGQEAVQSFSIPSDELAQQLAEAVSSAKQQ